MLTEPLVLFTKELIIPIAVDFPAPLGPSNAKHEGGIPEIDAKRDYPSDILDYFRQKDEIIEAGHMQLHLRNYLDKHHALNRTAEELTKKGLTFIAAEKLHKK